MKRLMKTKVSVPLILILIGIGIGVTFYTAQSTSISYAGANAYCFIFNDEGKTGLANGEVGWANIESGTWYGYARLNNHSESNSGSTTGFGNEVVLRDHKADVAAANSSVNSLGDDGRRYMNSDADSAARKNE